MLISPAASYGCEVLGTLCGQDLRWHYLALSHPVCIFAGPLPAAHGYACFCSIAELGDEPWDHMWWSPVIRFAGQLDAKPEGDLHRDILHDDILDARILPEGGSWAAQIARQCRALQLPAPFAADCHQPHLVL